MNEPKIGDTVECTRDIRFTSGVEYTKGQIIKVDEKNLCYFTNNAVFHKPYIDPIQQAQDKLASLYFELVKIATAHFPTLSGKEINCLVQGVIFSPRHFIKMCQYRIRPELKEGADQL